MNDQLHDDSFEEVKTHNDWIELRVERAPYGMWTAHCPDTYDGAEDAAGWSDNLIVTEKTREAAIKLWVSEYNDLWLEENTSICGTCNGSGEGFMPESRCTSCGGSGELSPLEPEEDYRY